MTKHTILWALCAVLSLPVCTLVMASFFQDISPDLEAAAMVDLVQRMALTRPLQVDDDHVDVEEHRDQ